MLISNLATKKTYRSQHGAVLVIAMIILIAMTLAGIGLIRSVYTTNIIAGNLAFKEAATSSADAGVEKAIAWLQSPTPGCTLTEHCHDAGYAASRTVKGATASWDDFWGVLITNDQIETLATDSVTGNTVSYAIERLCNETGAFADAECATATTLGGADGNDKSSPDPLNPINKVFYRITSRVDGPRNTVSYVQTVVAL